MQHSPITVTPASSKFLTPADGSGLIACTPVHTVPTHIVDASKAKPAPDDMVLCSLPSRTALKVSILLLALSRGEEIPADLITPELRVLAHSLARCTPTTPIPAGYRNLALTHTRVY